MEVAGLKLSVSHTISATFTWCVAKMGVLKLATHPLYCNVKLASDPNGVVRCSN